MNCRKAPIAHRATSTTGATLPAMSSSLSIPSRGCGPCRRASCACSARAPRRMCGFKPRSRRIRGKSFAVALPPGPYRFRTIEAGGEADARIAEDGFVPEVEATERGHCAADARSPGRIRRPQRHRPAVVLRHRRSRLGEGRVDRRARHRHAGVSAAVPRTALTPRRRSRDRPRRHRLHRPARLDQALRSARRRLRVPPGARSLRLFVGTDRASSRLHRQDRGRRGDGGVSTIQPTRCARCCRCRTRWQASIAGAAMAGSC